MDRNVSVIMRIPFLIKTIGIIDRLRRIFFQKDLRKKWLNKGRTRSNPAAFFSDLDTGSRQIEEESISVDRDSYYSEHSLRYFGGTALQKENDLLQKETRKRDRKNQKKKGKLSRPKRLDAVTKGEPTHVEYRQRKRHERNIILLLESGGVMVSNGKK